MWAARMARLLQAACWCSPSRSRPAQRKSRRSIVAWNPQFSRAAQDLVFARVQVEDDHSDVAVDEGHVNGPFAPCSGLESGVIAMRIKLQGRGDGRSRSRAAPAAAGRERIVLHVVADPPHLLVGDV